MKKLYKKSELCYYYKDGHYLYICYNDNTTSVFIDSIDSNLRLRIMFFNNTLDEKICEKIIKNLENIDYIEQYQGFKRLYWYWLTEKEVYKNVDKWVFSVVHSK